MAPRNETPNEQMMVEVEAKKAKRKKGGGE
jgi:hypothetical protein